jgi:hypothetical protein
MTIHVIFPSAPQAGPIIATGQGETSTYTGTLTLFGQGVLEAVFVDSPKAQINHTLPAT